MFNLKIGYLMAFVFLVILSGSLYANKSSVEIVAPDLAVKGSEILIKINVSHHGNNDAHHTSWAYVKVNGKEIARFEYPFESENFTREVKYVVNGPVEIKAMASCNLHGSAGEKTATIKIK